MTQPERFPWTTRLTRQADFQRVFLQGRSVADRNLVVYLLPNDLDWSRLGLRVGKRSGNAVCRNALRRRLREAFRRYRRELPVGFDIICIARASATGEFPELGRSLCALVSRAAKTAHPNRPNARATKSKRDGASLHFD